MYYLTIKKSSTQELFLKKTIQPQFSTVYGNLYIDYHTLNKIITNWNICANITSKVKILNIRTHFHNTICVILITNYH